MKSELDDVQTTVAVIDGLRARIAELEAENERLRSFEIYEVFTADDGEPGTRPVDWPAKVAELEATVQHERRMRDGLTDALRMAADDRDELFNRAEQAEAERDEFQQRLLDELAKNALTPTGRERLEQAEAALAEAIRRRQHAEFHLKGEQAHRDRAEAEVAQRDKMLQLAYEMEELPAEWDPEGYAIWLADLSARAQE